MPPIEPDPKEDLGTGSKGVETKEDLGTGNEEVETKELGTDTSIGTTGLASNLAKTATAKCEELNLLVWFIRSEWKLPKAVN